MDIQNYVDDEKKERIKKIFGWESYTDRMGNPAVRPHPEDSLIIKIIFDEYLKGVSIPNICRTLNGAKIRNRYAGPSTIKGAGENIDFEKLMDNDPKITCGELFKMAGHRQKPSWTRTTVSRILTYPQHAGLSDDYSESSYYSPGIIDKKKWEKVQELLNSSNDAKYTKMSNYLACGIIECQYCHSKYYPKQFKGSIRVSHKTDYEYYNHEDVKDHLCNNSTKRFSVIEVDGLIRLYLTKALSDTSVLQAFDQYKNKYNIRPIELLQLEIPRLEKELVEAKEEYQRRKATLSEDREFEIIAASRNCSELDMELKDRKKELEVKSATNITSDLDKDAALEMYDKASPTEKRELLHLIPVSILAFDKHIKKDGTEIKGKLLNIKFGKNLSYIINLDALCLE